MLEAEAPVIETPVLVAPFLVAPVLLARWCLLQFSGYNILNHAFLVLICCATNSAGATFLATIVLVALHFTPVSK